MNPTTIAIRAGVSRGWIELRQTYTNAQDLWSFLFPNAAMFVAILFQRGAKVPGTSFSLGATTLPSVIGMGIAFGGLNMLALQLSLEREDGTLLRAKAIPNGMVGYLVGKIVSISGMILTGSILILVPGLFLFDNLLTGGPSAWLTLFWVVLLGLIATISIGAVLGSLFSNPRNMGLIMLPTMGLVATSGIFYPITNYPVWLQDIGQAFPIYWLGLGMRSGLLPDSQAAAEIGGSWRHLDTAAVLGAWAIAGLVVAPIILRRMARRESGSAVAARRERALRGPVR